MMVSSPKITVLMPLFNGKRYVREAVESILGQTFADFEFLIIDDGSTDDSCAIVESYGDPRIRLITNGKNLGVTATLNRGIKLGRGEYIARMDCDDISLPTRLAEQIEYLERNPDCAMVAIPVLQIDEDGRNCGVWPDDRNTLTSEALYRFLPRANCIAHPGIMIRKSILSHYRYNEFQRIAQDYDLWLRMSADRLVITKLAKPLLKYREHSASVTSSSNCGMPDWKNVRTKVLFLCQQIRKQKWNCFCFKVLIATGRDLCYAFLKGLSRVPGLNLNKGTTGTVMDRDMRITAMNTWVMVRFLVAIGKGIGTLFPVRNQSSLFFFFPFLHVGGAEKVHTEIVSCVAEYKPWVFFTKRSSNNSFRKLFPPQEQLYNFWVLLKYGYPLSVGVMAGVINRHK
ncbi:MAG: glycosyltransferase, partial [Geobacteraceae bacterium]|nr:glycosyltransferase [Geobacteraceae bacterium]